MDDLNALRDLSRIFSAGVEGADPYNLVKKCINVRAGILRVSSEGGKVSFDLKNFKRIFILGTGKASIKMAMAAEEILSDRINDGLISVKYTSEKPLKRVRVVKAGHPLPDENSIRASIEILNLLKSVDDKTLIMGLISGGGSALLENPLEFHTKSESFKLNLKDIQKTTETLLRCGATIGEINCIRKHLSNIKGGRLTRYMYPATSLNLILSDVIGDRLDVIASGLTTFDNTTYGDALSIVKKFGIERDIPLLVLRTLESGAKGLIEETPKQGDEVFKKVHNIIIGTNYTSLVSTSREAKTLGYKTMILSSRISGEAREVAKVFFALAKDIKKRDLPIKKPACLIGGGETTVTVKGNGRGGRNQEMSLSFLREMEKEDENLNGIYFLSASTDGSDGKTDAAGAFASLDALKNAKERALSIESHLNNNDSYTFFEKAGYLFKTGPTDTNVCDIQILIVT